MISVHSEPDGGPIASVFGGGLVPGFRTIPGAWLTEVEFSTTDGTYKGGTYTGAVYDATGALVIESVRPAPMTTYRPVAPLSIDPATFHPAAVFPEAIYGGHFFYAWGHFLLETLSTAVVADSLPQAPVVFSPWPFSFNNEWTEGYKAHVKPLLRAAGWGDREIIISASSAYFGVLHVPHRTTFVGWPIEPRMIHESMAGVYGRLRTAFGQGEAGDVVVATRLSSHRRWRPDEDAIYDILAQRGARLLRVEEMTASEQVAAISRAGVLVGFSGSALHNAAFLPPGARVVEFGDDPSVTIPLPIQQELARIGGHSLTYVPWFEAGALPGPALWDAIFA